VKKVLRARTHPQAWVPRVVGHGDDSDVSVMFHAGLQFSTVRLVCATTIGRPVFPGGSIARLFRILGSFHPAESTSRYPSNSFHSRQLPAPPAAEDREGTVGKHHGGDLQRQMEEVVDDQEPRKSTPFAACMFRCGQQETIK
jgi:hypothetical protein